MAGGADDDESASVHLVMAVAAEQDAVVDVGRASVAPPLDVVGLGPAHGRPTARVAAAPVLQAERPALLAREGALLAAQLEHVPLAVDDGALHHGVAQQPAGGLDGGDRAGVLDAERPVAALRALPVGVERLDRPDEDEPGRFAAGDGRVPRGRECVDDADERVVALLRKGALIHRRPVLPSLAPPVLLGGVLPAHRGTLPLRAVLCASAARAWLELFAIDGIIGEGHGAPRRRHGVEQRLDRRAVLGRRIHLHAPAAVAAPPQAKRSLCAQELVVRQHPIGIQHRDVGATLRDQQLRHERAVGVGRSTHQAVLGPRQLVEISPGRRRIERRDDGARLSERDGALVERGGDAGVARGDVAPGQARRRCRGRGQREQLAGVAVADAESGGDRRPGRRCAQQPADRILISARRALSDLAREAHALRIDKPHQLRVQLEQIRDILA
nr:hypothetical protein [Agrococcus sp. Marseille-P2731]